VPLRLKYLPDKEQLLRVAAYFVNGDIAAPLETHDMHGDNECTVKELMTAPGLANMIGLFKGEDPVKGIVSVS